MLFAKNNESQVLFLETGLERSSWVPLSVTGSEPSLEHLPNHVYGSTVVAPRLDEGFMAGTEAVHMFNGFILDINERHPPSTTRQFILRETHVETTLIEWTHESSECFRYIMGSAAYIDQQAYVVGGFYALHTALSLQFGGFANTVCKFDFPTLTAGVLTRLPESVIGSYITKGIPS